MSGSRSRTTWWLGMAALSLGVAMACGSSDAKKSHAADYTAGGSDGEGGGAGAGEARANGGSGDSGGTASGGVPPEMLGGGAGDGAEAGGTAAGGSTAGSGDEAGASSQAGSPAGGVPGPGCIRTVQDGYVVRKDGAVLVEQRDTTKETAIQSPSHEPLTGAIAVAQGTYHGCALLDDGTVSCWRENASRGNWAGQLGNGKVDQDANAELQVASTVLVDIGKPLTGVTSLTRGGPALESTCAITTGHELYCWGDLAWLINKGVAISSPYAQAITTNGIEPLSGVQQASTSVNMACAIVDNGAKNELYCWGRNDYHNLGNGDNVSRQYPTKVTTLDAPSLVAVVDYNYALSGGGTVCAVDGGKLYCWGANGSGQTGTNVSGADVVAPSAVVIQDGTTPLPAPVELVGIANTFCALSGNQTVWCWGAYFNAAAGNYGATNVALLGGPFAASGNLYWLFYVTNDGQYHWGKEWARSPNCGDL